MLPTDLINYILSFLIECDLCNNLLDGGVFDQCWKHTWEQNICVECIKRCKQCSTCSKFSPDNLKYFEITPYQQQKYYLPQTLPLCDDCFYLATECDLVFWDMFFG